MYLLEKMINFKLSRRAKEAIKVALAFSIAYLIALKVGWLNPFWAAFTVGQVALFPGGQSLYKGFQRLAGLVPAVIVAVFIFAVAGQDRWLFVSLGVIWVMLATYLMIKDKKRTYMWNVAGFVVFIFLTTQFTSNADLFSNIASRLLDAILGISIYTLVTVFLWPETNIGALKKISINLITIQTKIFALIASQNGSSEDKNTIRQVIKQEILLINGLQQSLFAKGSETYQVQETAEFWKEFHSLSIQLGDSFSRLNNSSLGLKNIDIYRLIPDLDNYRETINQRLKLAENILKNGNQEFKTKTIRLSIDETYLASLRPFDQLAFMSSKKEFEQVEQLSRKILRCANNIMDESVLKKEAAEKVPSSIYAYLVPDIDLLKNILFMGSFVFSVFCIWIYFDPPGHMSWFYLPPTIAFAVAATPQMKTNKIVLPTFFILGFFILIYSVILPKLSGAIELGSILFICMFLVFYFLDGPLRLVGVIGASTKLLLHNEQTYSFEYAANMLLLNIGAYIFIYIFSYILASPRPQRAVLGKVRRYCNSARFLTSVAASNQTQQKGLWIKLKIEFYRYELKNLPLKIKSWSAAIDHKHFPKNTPDTIDDFLISIHVLSNSFDEWYKSNQLHQTPLMLNETKEELDLWRRGIEDIFHSYKNNLDSSLTNRMQNALSQHIINLEKIVNSHTKEIEEADIRKEFTDQEKENLFRLMGSYQGLSQSLIAYSLIVEQIDWAHWEEEVFA